MTSASPQVLFVSSDLLFTSRVQQAAKRLGVDLQVAASAEDGPASVALAILDLGHPNLNIVTAVSALKQKADRVLAFGPHVQEGKLAAAREAGCDQVVSRGEFHSRMEALLQIDGK